MIFHKIKIDEEVWQFLKKNAEPFKDTTPNDVLKRLLLKKENGSFGFVTKTQPHGELPNFPNDIPEALAQILEVIYGVQKLGMSRTQATNFVAQKRKLFNQTVIDKYCRRLHKRAYEIDQLLEPSKIDEFQLLLEQKFAEHRGVIKSFFESLKTQSIIPPQKIKELPTHKKISTEQLRYSIIKVLLQFEEGGTDRKEIMNILYEKYKDIFSQAYYQEKDSTGVRWKHTIDSERARMVRDGFIAKSTPRGIWELTQKGGEWYEEKGEWYEEKSERS